MDTSHSSLLTHMNTSHSSLLTHMTALTWRHLTLHFSLFHCTHMKTSHTSLQAHDSLSLSFHSLHCRRMKTSLSFVSLAWLSLTLAFSLHAHALLLCISTLDCTRLPALLHFFSAFASLPALACTSSLQCSPFFPLARQTSAVGLWAPVFCTSWYSKSRTWSLHLFHGCVPSRLKKRHRLGHERSYFRTLSFFKSWSTKPTYFNSWSTKPT